MRSNQPKNLWEIMGRRALLEHSSLSNLILYFAVSVTMSLMWARVPHSSLPTGVTQQQGFICPGDQSCCLSTDLPSHPQPVCLDDTKNSGETASDTNHAHSTFSTLFQLKPSELGVINNMGHVSHKWQPLDSSGTCIFRRLNVPQALSTAEHGQCIPQVTTPDFPPCYRLQQDLLLTGGPARPIPGTPLSPGCPGRPGAPLSP